MAKTKVSRASVRRGGGGGGGVVSGYHLCDS